jgi:hypothetical protein
LGEQLKFYFNAGLPAAGTKKTAKKLQFSMRNSVLGLILAIVGKNTALRAPRIPNSGMGNPNL